jgi:hypothetical protein
LKTNPYYYNALIFRLQEFVDSKYARKELSWFKLNTDFIKAAWALFFRTLYPSASFEESIRTPRSGHCKFTSGTLTTGSRSQPLFVKILPYPHNKKLDSILVDNINGFILNRILAKNLPLQGAFMVYVDSFLSFTQQRSSGTHRWPFALITDINDKASPFYIPSRPGSAPSTATALTLNAQISISNAVPGLSLQSYFNQACRSSQPLPICETILLKFHDFYSQKIMPLALQVGMLHNDFHLGNLLYDDEQKEIVCIDYGRMHFQYFCDNIDSELNRFCTIEMNKLHIDIPSLDSYRSIVDFQKNAYMWKSIHKPDIIENINYPYYVLDLMTLAANMYTFFLVSVDDNTVAEWKSLIDPFFMLQYTRKEELKESTFTIHVNDPTTTHANYQTFVKAASDKLDSKWKTFFEYVGKGLFYMAMVFSCEGLFTIRLNPERYNLFKNITNIEIRNRIISAFIRIFISKSPEPVQLIFKELQAYPNISSVLYNTLTSRLHNGIVSMDVFIELFLEFFDELDLNEYKQIPENIRRILDIKRYPNSFASIFFGSFQYVDYDLRKIDTALKTIADLNSQLQVQKKHKLARRSNTQAGGNTSLNLEFTDIDPVVLMPSKPSKPIEYKPVYMDDILENAANPLLKPPLLPRQKSPSSTSPRQRERTHRVSRYLTPAPLTPTPLPALPEAVPAYGGAKRKKKTSAKSKPSP